MDNLGGLERQKYPSLVFGFFRGHSMNGTLVLHEESEGAASFIHGFRSGAADARDAAARFVPEAARILRRCAYQTGYGLAYGVVFPSMLIALRSLKTTRSSTDSLTEPRRPVISPSKRRQPARNLSHWLRLHPEHESTLRRESGSFPYDSFHRYNLSNGSSVPTIRVKHRRPELRWKK